MLMVESRVSPGDRFGRLTVLRPAERKPYVVCRCECGGETTVYKYSLLSGATRSCGCLQQESRTVHGQYRTPEYRIWRAMTQRCSNPRRSWAHLYEGRGITVCAEWRESFAAFYRDMGPRPSPRHSLDRIDNDKGYALGNVRWATPAEQSRNTRRTHRLTMNGQTLCVTDWAARLGISRDTLAGRLRYGWSVERALTEPPRPWGR